MDTGNWITVTLFGLGVLAGAYGFVWRLEKRVSTMEVRCITHQPVIDSIAQLNSRLDKVAADQETFWKILGPHLANIIHSPKSVNRDELVARLTRNPDDITNAELDELIGLLEGAIQQTEWSAEKRLAGAWLLARATTIRTARTRECA